MKSNEKKRPIIGVVSTQTSDIEQRRFLSGIIGEAMKFGYDTVIISNIFNPVDSRDGFQVENRIYDLICSPDIDAFIVLLESFVNKKLHSVVLDRLRSQRHKPIVALGNSYSNFTLPGFIHVNSDDEADFEAITDHLIDVHGFTDIDMITGITEVETSHMRVNGYRRSLEKHSIQYDEEKVYFSNFWLDGGHQLAQRYISGERPLPQAVVCANDYMAYGILEEFLEKDIRVPEDITVIGFENVGQRRNYSPSLTTYQRNRAGIGRKAVRIIHSLLSGGTADMADDVSMLGEMITGNSCGCGISKKQLIADLEDSKNQRINTDLSLFSLMDQRLTECKSISDFITVLKKYAYLINNVDEIYFCLLEKWFDETSESELLNCFPVISSEVNDAPLGVERLELAPVFAQFNEPGAYYYSPMFFADRLMGYTALRYDHPDDYEYIFRSWLKSVSNALEFLRMKNDIRYLSKCRNVSDLYDSLTGLYNVSGFENAVNYAVSAAKETDKLIIIVIKTEIFPSEIQFDRQDVRIEISNEIAAIMQDSVQYKNTVCGRLNNTSYACAIIGDHDSEYVSMLTDKLRTLVLHRSRYVKEFGMDSFLCVNKVCDSVKNFSYKPTMRHMSEMIDKATADIMQKKTLLQYREFTHFRDKMYLEPEAEADPEQLCHKFDIGLGHFRHIYKSLFDISFNQDCIAARMYQAQYLLLTTTCGVSEIAEKCGYFDQKYFMRLFRKFTGCTANQYREKMLTTET